MNYQGNSDHQGNGNIFIILSNSICSNSAKEYAQLIQKSVPIAVLICLRNSPANRTCGSLLSQNSGSWVCPMPGPYSSGLQTPPVYDCGQSRLPALLPSPVSSFALGTIRYRITSLLVGLSAPGLRSYPPCTPWLAVLHFQQVPGWLKPSSRTSICKSATSWSWSKEASATGGLLWTPISRLPLLPQSLILTHKFSTNLCPFFREIFALLM